MPTANFKPAAFRAALLRWYHEHARSLPWRGTQDAYRIWISEVMLQQTQIATVIPYYERFLRAFPELKCLAAARFEKVAAQWSGLGYYRRARHLHLAAQKIMSDFEGKFPSDYGQARTLPGVGHYTACAVLSMAYRVPLAVLDGNVARVMARFYAVKGNLQDAEFRRFVDLKLRDLISTRKPGDFNHAMMELGQTLCLPLRPQCQACPLGSGCLARRTGSPEDYPEPRTRRAIERHYLAVAIIRKERKMALVRGLDDGLLNDLWNFPAAFGDSERQAAMNLKLKLKAVTGARCRIGAAAGVVRHGITFRSIRVSLHSAEIPHDCEGSFRWLSSQSLDRAAVSQLARKIANAVQNGS
ncbi:MAG TPA: A/G-specific adenine glycosylase [Terriglobia bacterium]|nr:A/G-specific adenine glycosylase [Terriglobia bacterium]